MGRVKDTAGRPRKYNEPCKNMYFPVRLEKEIRDFVDKLLGKEKK